jgi:mannose-6-phosphate isomerase-like protein (cupin superfamily)
MPHPWQTLSTAPQRDVLAPDGSEIRLLAQTSRGSMVHCALPPGQVTVAVAHRTVEELWYCLRGRGEMWRRLGEAQETKRPWRCAPASA